MHADRWFMMCFCFLMGLHAVTVVMWPSFCFLFFVFSFTFCSMIVVGFCKKKMPPSIGYTGCANFE
jgi:phosphatidylglycerophosphate synthase